MIQNIRIVFSLAWKQLTIARGEAEGNSQLFPGQTESREGSVIICFIFICILSHHVIW